MGLHAKSQTRLNHSTELNTSVSFTYYTIHCLYQAMYLFARHWTHEAGRMLLCTKVSLLYALRPCAQLLQSCPALCNPMDCSPPGFFVYGDSSGKNTGMGCHALLQGIFPTQGLNSSIPHCSQILYHLSHHGSPWQYFSSVQFSRSVVLDSTICKNTGLHLHESK